MSKYREVVTETWVVWIEKQNGKMCRIGTVGGSDEIDALTRIPAYVYAKGKVSLVRVIIEE